MFWRSSLARRGRRKSSSTVRTSTPTVGNGPDASGDAIRNGAVDNATGTAEVLEIARAFKTAPAPARTVIFALWTAEEKGLLGSEFYAAHPLYPLAGTAAVINLDPHVVLPAARDVELIGGGRTSLEEDLARVAKTRHLRVTEEPSSEAGWYFRSGSLLVRAARCSGIGFPRGSRPRRRRHRCGPASSFRRTTPTATTSPATSSILAGRLRGRSRKPRSPICLATA
jgi:hypothetical protein